MQEVYITLEEAAAFEGVELVRILYGNPYRLADK